MASSGYTCCLICCESEQMPELPKSDQMVKQFFKHLKTYLLSDSDIGKKAEDNFDKFANTPKCLCTKCIKLMESFSDLYKILRETELKLGGTLLELKNGLLTECSQLRHDLKAKKFRGALGRTCAQQAKKVYQKEALEDLCGDLYQDNDSSRSRAKRKFSSQPPAEDVPEAKKKKEDNSNSDPDQFISKTEYPCNVKTCKEVMFSLQDLQKHKKFHGPFSCSNCGKLFEYAPDLCLHEKVHGNPNKFGVDVCPRKACKFRSNYAYSDSKRKAEYIQHFLKFHLKLDIPKHTISCGMCAVGFTQKVHFNIHFDICHNLDKLGEGEEACICDWDSDECTAYFLTSDQLAKHKYLMHSRKFECDECSESFSKLTELRRHLMGVHGKNELTNSNGDEVDESVSEVEEVTEWILPDFAEVERIDVGEVKEEKPCIDSDTLFIEDDDLLPASIKKESGMQ